MPEAPVPPHYDVIMYEVETRRIASISGRNLSYAQAAQRRRHILAGQIEPPCGAAIVPAGSYALDDLYAPEGEIDA